MEFFFIPSLILVTLMMTSFSPASSDPRDSEAGRICTPTKVTPSSVLAENYAAAMDSITAQINRFPFAGANFTSPLPGIAAFGQCHTDLSRADCFSCFIKARAILPHCLPAAAGSVFLEGCILRYSADGEPAPEASGGVILCGSSRKHREEEDDDDYVKAEFTRKVRDDVAMTAERSRKSMVGFGVERDRGGVEDVYVLAQCWRIGGGEQCRRCVADAGERLATECADREGAAEGRALFGDCYVRYSTEKFFDIDPKVLEVDEILRFWIIRSGIYTAVIFLTFCGVIAYIKNRRKKSKQIKALDHGTATLTTQHSRLNFKYETLAEATEYFDVARKLGQGGAGSVFKGVMADGSTVAVKRLFFNTRQWADEFFNEVNLIRGIDHGNVVKLLGCSIEGPESLLVYEFVPNRSLDQVLFDKSNTAMILSWKQRFSIICGIADGLAHLHGGAAAKIIHRDIKTSNILLGQDLNPKIADFGLARSVASDRTHVSTGIAGTLGYMAPEYLVRGQLSEKADVYAFGVTVLEIASGRRNSAFTTGSSSVLHSVWKLHKENEIVSAVDPALKGDFPVEEASTVLRIGLVCTQASVPLRPSMGDVVRMLSDAEGIPSPKQPPFLNASLLSPGDGLLRDGSDNESSTLITCPYTFGSNTITDREFSTAQLGG